MPKKVGLINCYEALTDDDRPYRDAMAPLKALTLLKDDVVADKYDRKIFEKFAYSLIYISELPLISSTIKTDSLLPRTCSIETILFY